MNHATMHLMKKLFIQHNHNKFNVYCYSYGKKKDEVTEEIKKVLLILRIFQINLMMILLFILEIKR